MKVPVPEFKLCTILLSSDSDSLVTKETQINGKAGIICDESFCKRLPDLERLRESVSTVSCVVMRVPD